MAEKLLIWSYDEMMLLQSVWPHAEDTKSIMHLFPRVSNESQLKSKAYSMKLKKTEFILSLIREKRRILVTHRNKTVLGRSHTYESLSQIAKQYKSTKEFYQKDNSAYVIARNMRILDEICSHMTRLSFNYPQTILFLCIEKIFPDNVVLCNDRTAIAPYEIDVFLPELKIGFEYDGVNWHQSDSAKQRDALKDQMCISNGIKLFRITELKKQKQEDFIVPKLAEFGFNVSEIDKEEISEIAWSKKMTVVDVIDEISKYKSLKEFRLTNAKLYNNLMRMGKLEEFTKQFQRPISATREEILSVIAKCKTKKEFYEDHHREYCKMKKANYEDCLLAYENI